MATEQPPSSESDEVHMQGWVVKQGAIFHTWRRRYLTLTLPSTASSKSGSEQSPPPSPTDASPDKEDEGSGEIKRLSSLADPLDIQGVIGADPETLKRVHQARTVYPKLEYYARRDADGEPTHKKGTIRLKDAVAVSPRHMERLLSATRRASSADADVAEPVAKAVPLSSAIPGVDEEAEQRLRHELLHRKFPSATARDVRWALCTPHRIYLFFCDSVEEGTRWVQAINGVLEAVRQTLKEDEAEHAVQAGKIDAAEAATATATASETAVATGDKAHGHSSKETEAKGKEQEEDITKPVHDDTLTKLVDKADSKTNAELLRRAAMAELDPTAVTPDVPRAHATSKSGSIQQKGNDDDDDDKLQGEEEEKDAGILDRAIEEIKALEDTFLSCGFRPATWGYIGASLGTSMGISVALERIPDAVIKHILDEDEDDEKALAGFSIIQKAIVGIFERSLNILESIEAETLEISRISISVAGLYLDIPSLTSTIVIVDQYELKEDNNTKKPAGAEAGSGKDQAEEEKDPSTAVDATVVAADGEGSAEPIQKKASFFTRIGRGVAHAADLVTDAITLPFRFVGENVLHRIWREVAELERMALEAGVDISPSVSITIGTYVGIGISFKALPDGFDVALIKDASMLQRVMLQALTKAKQIATAATADTLTPNSIFLCISGIGLAVPSVSATCYMEDADNEPKALELIDKELGDELQAAFEMDAKRAAEKAELKGDSSASDAKKDQTKSEKQEELEKQEGTTTFVLEAWGDLRDAGSHVAALTSRATMKAVRATGKAGQKVIGAVYGALENVCTTVFTEIEEELPVHRTMQIVKSLRDKLPDSPLTLAHPDWLALSFGTTFGASIRFKEREPKAVLETDQDKIRAKKAEASSKVEKLLLRSIHAVIHSAKMADEMRYNKAHIDLLSLNVAGIGLGIPKATSSIFIGYDADDDKP